LTRNYDRLGTGTRPVSFDASVSDDRVNPLYELRSWLQC